MERHNRAKRIGQSVRLRGRDRVPQAAALLALMMMAGCVQNEPPRGAGANSQSLHSLPALIAAAKAEGQLTVIALPHDWCNYAGVISGFKETYGIDVTELNPDAGSSDEIEAIKSTTGDKQHAPDVVDLGTSFAARARQDGLLQAYKVSAWNQIADNLKDADGYWSGDYFGVMTFEVNKALVKRSPQDWSELTSADYRHAVALAGDPRLSNQAIMAVYAAGRSSGGISPADAANAGLKFFADLKTQGNFVPTIGKAATLVSGTTPIVLRWDYNALADRETLHGDPDIDVVVPSSLVIGDFYAQAISAFAPHPNAARLWMEYLYSDAGQIAFLRGLCHPVRYNELAEQGKIPADLAATLPPPTAYKNVIFLPIDDRKIIKSVVTSGWDNVVGADVK